MLLTPLQSFTNNVLKKSIHNPINDKCPCPDKEAAPLKEMFKDTFEISK